jgi:uncharacterized membrane protein YphA (DoxX/SURF4 family)
MEIETTDRVQKYLRWYAILIITLTIFLGLVFTFSGIGKIFVFRSFANSVASLTHFSYSVSSIVSFCVIGFEISGGIALLLRYRISLFITLFSILIGTFVITLIFVVVGDKTFLCHCFGIFDIGLSNYQELILDVLLLDVLVLLGFANIAPKKSIVKIKASPIMIIIVVIYAEFSLLQPLARIQDLENRTNVSMAVLFAENEVADFKSMKSSKRILFLLNYEDFSCSPCFTSFSLLSDSLCRRLPINDRFRVIGIFKENDMIKNNTPMRLQHWKEANGFVFPVIVASDSLFVKMHQAKSAVLLVGENARALFLRPFPLSPEQFNMVLQLME